MSDVTTTTRSYRHKLLPDITINGKVWKARTKLAEKVGITPRSAQRLPWRSVLIGGVIYCPEEESLADLVAKARRRNEPAKRRRAG